MRIYFGLLFGLLPLLAQDLRVYQLSGMAVSATTGEPIPFVSVRVGHTRRGTMANADGFYSLPVIRGDTLYFSAVGYKRGRLILNEYLAAYKGDTTEGFLYAVHYLVEDTIELPPVRISAIRTPEELKLALLNIPLETQLQVARDNVSPEIIAYFLQNLPLDPQERIKVAQQRYRDLYFERTLRPTYPILDPIAAYRLIQYLTEKAQVKKEKIYDYWQDD
ncbi:MAG: carboxypeptidase-like regulatory domain-containing protein [Bacteroidia bacterium]|nr:carboxypeptidase-like regulatory domain-containing protein [Bacteroidia bacterium]MDW8134109.1 carboxypeptidase-like regulatory domain-containing protein [Bacteroidia bacterium]